jgi:hypothetical protein
VGAREPGLYGTFTTAVFVSPLQVITTVYVPVASPVNVQDFEPGEVVAAGGPTILPSNLDTETVALEAS